jgi:hypothetical protein
MGPITTLLLWLIVVIVLVYIILRVIDMLTLPAPAVLIAKCIIGLAVLLIIFQKVVPVLGLKLP